MNDFNLKNGLYWLITIICVAGMAATRGAVFNEDPSFNKTVVFFICLVLLAVVGINKVLDKKKQQQKIKRNLLPYYTEQDIEEDTQYYIATNMQNIPPSYEEEPIQTHANVTKERAIPFFLKKALKTNDHRYYIMLAGSGMGKTTFLINLYLQYISQFNPKHDLKLIPFNNLDGLKEIKDMPIEDRRNTILLLDAFDEDPKAVADYKKRLHEVMTLVWNFKTVVITCRTQFFPNEKSEPYEILIPNPRGGHFHFKKMYLSPFDIADCKKYLNKKFSFFPSKKKKRAFEILLSTPQIMVRPMLLSRIDDLLTGKKEYNFKTEIYEQMIKNWLYREREKQVLPEEEKQVFEKNLGVFSKEVAKEIYATWQKTGQLYLPYKEIETIANNCKIDLNEWKLTGKSLLNRNAFGNWKFAHKSILEYYFARFLFEKSEKISNKDFQGIDFAEELYEELILVNFLKQFQNQVSLYYNHESKMLAISDKNNISKGFFKPIQFNALPKQKDISQLHISNQQAIYTEGLKKFYNLNSITLHSFKIPLINKKEVLKNITFNIASLSELEQIGNNNIYLKLRGANLIRAKLRGADLRGADLSDADLSGAKLSVANLSVANLRGAYLREAKLIRAKLSEADLSEAYLILANLNDADLSDADLSGANLSGAYLREANLIRAKLRGAYLREAKLSEADLSDADLSDADLSRANLIRANLSGANLREAKLSEADLREANLIRAKLRGAYLSEAKLSEADLSDADLSRANLIRANLSDADLSRANLSEADLSRAIVSKLDWIQKLKEWNVTGVQEIQKKYQVDSNSKKYRGGTIYYEVVEIPELL